MTYHLFLFSVGPVQSFIAQARKTQDLYAGSRILGELVYEASKCAKEHGVELIFPKNINQGSSVPNRFIGKVSGKSASEMEHIGEAIEEVAQQKFKQLAESALSNAGFSVRHDFEQQILNHLDINWLFHPIEGEDDASYRNAYKEIETYMASVKNARVFKQFDYMAPKGWEIDGEALEFTKTSYLGEKGRKCSLDGERNALFFGNGSNDRFSKQGREVRRNDVRINQNEGLSAVSLTKRYFEDDRTHEGFPSTAEVAIMNKIAQKKGQFEMFRACLGLGAKEFDAQLCFKENMTEKYLKKNGYEIKSDVCTLEQLQANTFSDSEIPSYYALVAFDGDKMGKFLCGDPSVFKGTDLIKFQGELSAYLSQFAEAVQTYFYKTDKGAVVYTGGDDFLGFVNLVSLFEVTQWLRETFDTMVSKKLSEGGYFQDNINFTFSAGIAIAHYKTPLSMVLSKARKLEKTAKDKGGRNAFAIGVMKKSGESHETTYKWELGEGLKYWKAIQDLVLYFENGYCSETFVRNLIREFYILKDNDGNIPDNGMVKLELSRLVKKSMTDKGKKIEGKTAEVQRTVETLMLSKERRIGNLLKLETFTEAVSIALFLKRNRKNSKTENQSTTR